MMVIATSSTTYALQPYQNLVMRKLLLKIVQVKAKTPSKLDFYQGHALEISNVRKMIIFKQPPKSGINLSIHSANLDFSSHI